MTNYFQLSTDDKRMVLQQAASQYGLPPQAIEKDIWVTTILQIIFSLPVADKLIFKGGTSLSKVWGLIDRFSEDIDLAIDRSAFGLDGDLTKLQIKKLRKASSTFVREDFKVQIQNAIGQYGLDRECSIEHQPDGTGDDTYPEPRKLFVRYRSAWAEPLGYLSPVVMLEVGARSLSEPNAPAKIKSMTEQLFPSIQTSLIDNSISTAVASKTFLEKVFLIHELFSVDGHGIKAERKSRHLYDLSRMMDKDFALDAIKDDDLWESIRHHREIFTSVKGVDYTPDVRHRIVLVPRPDIIKIWEADYHAMSSAMIFGDKPSFSELISRMSALEDRFHRTAIR